VVSSAKNVTTQNKCLVQQKKKKSCLISLLTAAKIVEIQSLNLVAKQAIIKNKLVKA